MTDESLVLDLLLLDAGDDCRVYETTIEGHNVVFEVGPNATAWDVAKAALRSLDEEERTALSEKCAEVRDEIARRIY